MTAGANKAADHKVMSVAYVAYGPVFVELHVTTADPYDAAQMDAWLSAQVAKLK